MNVLARAPAPLLAAMLLLSACGGPEATGGKGDGSVRASGPAIRIEAPEPVSHGDPVAVTVTVVNTGFAPVLLRSVSLFLGSESVAGGELAARYPARGEAGGALALDGVLEVELIGPEARLPAPPRWKWSGGDAVVTAPVLGPGERFSFGATVRPTEATGARLGARGTYVPIGPTLTAFRVTRLEVRPVESAPAGPMMRGWVASQKASALLERASRLGDGVEPLAPADSGDSGPLELPRIYRFAFREAELQATAALDLRAERALAVRPPAFPLASARRKTGIDEGPATFFAAGEGWLLVEPSRKRCVLVSERALTEVRGNATRLVEALEERPVVPVQFRDAAEPAAAELAKACRAIELAVSDRPEKGGGRRITVEVSRSGLPAFLATVQRLGFEIDGQRLIRPPP